MASVNLWELITTIASSKYDLPNRDRCVAIRDMQGPRFGSELSLDINENGVWAVRIYDHDDSTRHVRVTINPNGFVQVTRGRFADGIYEERTVSF